MSRLVKKVSFFLNNLLDNLFPDKCIYCSNVLTNNRISFASHRFPICTACNNHKLKKIKLQNRCNRCLSTLQNKDCSFCKERHVYFDTFISSFFYTKSASVFLESLKYKNRESLIYSLLPNLLFTLKKNKVLNLLLKNSNLQIMEVPMSFFSFRKRGFSQLSIVKSVIQKKWKLKELSPLRKVAKPSQHFKNKIQRALEIHGSFKIKKAFQKKITGSILLLDDVFTTGTTVNEVARILKENGAEQVFVLCFFYKDLDLASI